MFVAVWLVPLRVLVAFFKTNDFTQRDLKSFGIESHVETVAQVTAGIAGILLAVIVFSVQLHAQRDDEGAFMTRYLVKKHLIPWIAGFALGLTAFDGSVLLLHVIWFDWIWEAVAVIDLVGLVLLLGATFWLIYRSLLDATKQTYEVGIGLFRRDLAWAMAHQNYLNALSVAFETELKELKFERGHPAFRKSRWFQRLYKDRIELEFTCRQRRGIITDINLRYLKRLATLLSQSSKNGIIFTGQLLVGPGGQIDGGPALVIYATQRVKKELPTHRSGNQPTASEEEQADLAAKLFDDEFRRGAANLLERIFHTGKESRPGESEEYLEKFAFKLKQVVSDGQVIEFAQLLESHSRIVELFAAAIQASEQSRVKIAINMPLEYEFFDIVRLAFTSNDGRAVETLIDAIQSYYSIGARANAASLCGWSLRLLAFIYWTASSEDSKVFPSSQLSERFDRLLHSIFIGLSSRHRGLMMHEDEELELPKEQPLIDLAISFCLELVRRAILTGKDDHADYFIDRLFEFRDHSRPAEQAYEEAPTRESSETVHDYALIALVGWCFAYAETTATSLNRKLELHQRIRTLIDSYCPSREAVAAIWELYHLGRRVNAIDDRLGLSRLEFEQKLRRVGKPYASMGRPDWQRKGVLCAMLLAKSQSTSYRTFFAGRPARDTWDSVADEASLYSMAKIAGLGLQPTERTRRVREVVQLIQERQMSADVESLLKIAELGFDEAEIVKFKNDVANSWGDHRALLEYVGQRACDKSISIAPPPATAFDHVPIEAFQSDNSWSGFGGELGEHLARREAIFLFADAVKRTATFADCTHLSQLGDQILLAKKELESRGYAPDIVMIPGNDRFTYALYKRPVWEVSTRRLAIGAGRWQELAVVEWPFRDPQSVLILDSKSLFGRIAVAQTPEIRIEPPPAESKNDFIKSVKHASEIAQLPKSYSLTAKAIVTLVPQVGFVDLGAALNISIVNSDAMFLITADKSFHRPSCPTIAGKEIISRTLSPYSADDEENFEPCDICKSARWDSDAWTGESGVFGASNEPPRP
jgi:hypothetical protein